MEFEDFSQDFNDLWTADYGETIKGPADIFDLSYLLDGGQSTTPEVVLNDRLMSEASLGLISQVTKTSVNPTTLSVLAIPIKSEHSYSLSRDNTHGKKGDEFLDIDEECFPAVSIAEAEGTQAQKESDEGQLYATNVDDTSYDARDIDQFSNSDTMSCCDDAEFTDDFVLDDCAVVEACAGHGVGGNEVESDQSVRNDINVMAMNSQMYEYGCRNQLSGEQPRKIDSLTSICSTNPSLHGFPTYSDLRHTFLSSSAKLITQNYPNSKSFLPLKAPISEHSFQQSCEQNGNYPPTPPSSSSSDNESVCTSPPRTPLYETLSPQYCSPIRKFSLKSSRTPISTPLISSQPKGAIGALNLTEEEKRTLTSEGYPVPQKLPLTKTEEKSLKKIRRKIKNKISAQESRRKKKEYMDKLEAKMEGLVTENCEYKKRLTILQKKNTSLLQELKSLQNIVARDEGRRSDNDCPLNL